MNTFYNKVKSTTSLRKAWKKVYTNGLQSTSTATRKDIQDFELKADQQIDQIYRKLLHHTFKFSPAKGIAAKKPGKTKRRPIVIAPIESRIVQRSILDALHSCDKIKAFEQTPTSFGGIEKRGVPEAIEALTAAINNDYQWYIKSDISDFFTSIPKEHILAIINNAISEPLFLDLFSAAVNVELENMIELGGYAEIFPLHEIGVAQGCCLSPLLGNLFLNDFDLEMNSRGIKCLRYIDDFIVLGKNFSNLQKAFESGCKMLAKLNLNVYKPDDGSGKSSSGNFKDGINFLGCDIRPGGVRPDTKARARLLKRIDEMVALSSATPPKLNYLSLLNDVQHLLQGWGHSYSFCTDKILMRDLDIEVDKRLKAINYNFGLKIAKSKDFRDIRRLKGIFLLCDSVK